MHQRDLTEQEQQLLRDVRSLPPASRREIFETVAKIAKQTKEGKHERA